MEAYQVELLTTTARAPGQHPADKKKNEGKLHSCLKSIIGPRDISLFIPRLFYHLRTGCRTRRHLGHDVARLILAFSGWKEDPNRTSLEILELLHPVFADALTDI